MRFLTLFVACSIVSAAAKKAPPSSPLDQYLERARQGSSDSGQKSPGSIYTPTAPFADVFRDLRAGRLYDLVTIVVSDNTSAVSSGATDTSRKSAANAGITALGGQTKATGPLANLANMNGTQTLQGQGTTSRQTTLTTTLTAQVVAVLPNGNIVVEGRKELGVNSEHQVITVRGIVRPDDLTPANSISSAQIAMLEVKVNGKGVVADSVKRPFILYRLLMGLLPF